MCVAVLVIVRVTVALPGLLAACLQAMLSWLRWPGYPAPAHLGCYWPVCARLAWLPPARCTLVDRATVRARLLYCDVVSDAACWPGSPAPAVPLPVVLLSIWADAIAVCQGCVEGLPEVPHLAQRVSDGPDLFA